MKVKNGLTTLRTGGSKNDGGKAVDPWVDFRFLQDGQTPVWSVTENDGWWVLNLKDVSTSGEWSVKILVMPSTHAAELAWDATLEFLDRLRERRVPRFIDSPDSLMSFCVKAAVRQR